MIPFLVLALALTSVQPANDAVYRVGRGVSAPRLICRAAPEYTQAARDAVIEGTVVIYCVIDSHGATRDRRVVRGLGYGLDEAALEAVSQWFFHPGTKDGNPVAVAASIEVTFRIDGRTQQVAPQVCGGVPQPDGQVIQSLANHGNPGAQYVMGCAYYRGQGVHHDYVQAHMWFNLAAAQGLEKAARARDAVSQKMTPEQMSEAQARARTWTASKD